MGVHFIVYKIWNTKVLGRGHGKQKTNVVKYIPHCRMTECG